MKTITFKNKKFIVEKGTTHPDYSYFTFEEEGEFKNMYWDIKPEEVVFDVGASYGAYTLTACALGARVYSFEPEKTIFIDLKKNIDLNNWGNTCFAYNIGFWDSQSSVDMKSYAPHWPAFTITSNYSMTTMDSFVENNNITKMDWLKIDVEGAEEKVINGAFNIIKRFKPKLIIECHDFLNPDISNNVKTKLASIGYFFEEVARPPCVMLVSK